MGSPSATYYHPVYHRAIAQLGHPPFSIAQKCLIGAGMIHEGDIDLDPEYQRGMFLPLTLCFFLIYTTGMRLLAVVWSSTKQMAIIDSLFHNYYVPPVVFAISRDPIDGVETRLCVDGKQRLTSIQKFFDGQVRFMRIYNPSSFSENISSDR
jgi:Protein of unknown function DUF262